MRILTQVERTWEYLANDDPLWAICTDPQRKGCRWDIAEFKASGEREIQTVLEYISKLGVDLNFAGSALDFGCGVGRLTQPLGKRFQSCYGVDISPTMIRLAQELNHDRPHCRFLLNEDARLNSLLDNYFGFIYTSIVLQHIEEPYSHKYIAELLRVLKPGGVLVFQAPERLRASKITRVRIKLAVGARVRSILGPQKRYAMEMHCIKERVIRKLVVQSGAQVVDVQITNSCEPSFSGNLQYLIHEPQTGYVSKQYCVIKQ